MSSQPGRVPPLPVREAATCMCAHGDACSSFAPGHALHLIQSRLASATPREWVDGIVEHADAGGRVFIRTLDGEPIVVWSAALADGDLAAGTPIALHRRYHVLAVGQRRHNVAA